MGKKNKHQDSVRRPKYTLDLPEIINMDDVACLSDESISERISRLESDRNSVLASSDDARPWEVEIAYLRREQQIRGFRRQLHDSYLRSNPSDDYDYVYDNHAFLSVNDEDATSQVVLN